MSRPSAPDLFGELAALRAELADRYVAAQAELDRRVDAIGRAIAERRSRAEVRRLLDELIVFVDATAAGLDESARAWLTDRFPAVYEAGARSAVPSARIIWTHALVAVLTSIASTTLAELLAATRFLRSDARRFQQRTLVVAATARLADPGDQAAVERLARPVIDRGLRAVRYSNGSYHPIGAHAEMILRTVTVRAANTAVLDQLEAQGVAWVEVSDGADCGWRFHSDPDTADRTVRSLDDARGHLLAHPNCSRSFSGRPDIRTAVAAAGEAAATLRERRAAARATADESRSRARVAARQRRLEQLRQRNLRQRSGRRRRAAT